MGGIMSTVVTIISLISMIAVLLVVVASLLVVFSPDTHKITKDLRSKAEEYAKK
ncbi:hypothetical protein [Candidatus Absconditicoccus praedator]|uniref:hypothetical protein n=1 Tax=Candidatus Absconditicoccus praedator TaxID=2735562 RepID=UPI001E39CFAD|nr:hypothetical protein [Candidatus Absconditicoccus praedator]UFX83112.1 hypothetical protein HLG78_03185 [Candidatus Absconditicoccus praedator]